MTRSGTFEHPERIGPYQILQVIGEGGMGVVYEAEQKEPVRRRVALKMMKVGMDTKEVVGRFESERQALAVMEHPGIAKVLDAGTSELGRPYFVMELVRGIRLDEYCDQRRLSTRDRVELFIKVCEAVQHAHQKGVIHRDLKPNNVLVAEENARPRPKIIDFGIAKATGHRLADQTVVTTYGQALGTLAYMSPEQAEMSGLDVDTRTDVYSLGVMLFELLTGEVPLDPQEVGVPSFLAQLIQRDQTMPTLGQRLARVDEARLHPLAKRRRADPTKLRKELAGDLQWIVLRAMDKDRSRRYETANGFAMDLRRYLAHEPVTARPPTAPYRLGKFVRRNRVGVAFASTAAIGLIAFSVILADARNQAEARRDQAEDLIDFMLTDLRMKLEPLGQLEILDEVGEQALSYFSSIPETEFSDAELTSRALALHQIGQVRLQQGRLQEAEPPFNESLRLAEALSRRDPEDSERLFDLGQSQFWVGSLAYRRGEVEGAKQAFERYRDISMELVARDSMNLSWQLERGYSHTNIGVLLLEQGDSRAALDEFQSSLAVKEWVARAEPESTRRRYDVAQGHFNVGIARAQIGDLRGARESFVADVVIKEALVAAIPDNAPWVGRLAVSRGRLAGVVEALEGGGSALQLRRRQWEDGSWLIEHDASNTTWRSDLASTRSHLGRSLVQRGEIATGLAHTEAALRTFEQLVASDSTNAQWPARLTAAHRRHAEALLLAGRVAEALDVAQGGVHRLRSLPAATDERRAMGLGLILGTLAEVQVESRDAEGANASWEEALVLLDALPTASSDWSILVARAKALVGLGRTAEATPLIEQLDRMGVSFGEWWLVAPK